MKSKALLLLITFLFICTAGCNHKPAAQPTNEIENEAITPLPETNAEDNNKEDSKQKEIDETLVLKENPVYERSISPTTYHYALPNYDIVSFEFAIENEYSQWNDMPLTKITDFIYKQYKGKDRPVIWVYKCELLNVETDWLSEQKLMTICNVGFELIVNNKTESVYGYYDGILYKADRTQNSDDYQPEVAAKFPKVKERILPIMAPKEYVHYTLYTPPYPIEFQQLSILQAVNELFESALIPNTPPSELEEFYILYDGNTKYNDKDAYEFTLGYGYDIKTMYHFFRMGVTVDHEYYTYEIVPFDTNKTISVHLEPPVPSGYGRSNSSMVRKYYQDDSYSLDIPVPRFRTTQFLTPEIAALGLVKLFDNALINGTTLIKPYLVQSLKTTPKYSVSIYKDYTRLTPNMLKIIWTGVDNINEEEALVFNVNKINVAISQSGKLYTYVPKPVYGGKLKENKKLPRLRKEYATESVLFRFDHSELFMEKTGTYVSKHMTQEKDIQPLQYLTPEDSEQYIDDLIDEYKGESNNMPWIKYLYKNGEINGEKTYEFQIGQEYALADYLIRFNAAISESGRIYIYENGSPRYIRRINFE